MLDGVVVAAGLSSRTWPLFKPTLDLAGRTLVERSVASLLPFCRRVLVVVGHRGDEVALVLQRMSRVEIVENPDYADGMASSLRAGFRRVDTPYCLFLPGDCPFVPGSVPEAMLAHPEDLLVPTFGGRPGHPVLLSLDAVHGFLDASPGLSLRAYLAARGVHSLEVGHPGVLRDIDTLDDWRAAQDSFPLPRQEAAP